MTQKSDYTKRLILENLNGHLQVQATRLKSVNMETDIFPKLNIQTFDNKTFTTSNKPTYPDKSSLIKHIGLKPENKPTTSFNVSNNNSKNLFMKTYSNVRIPFKPKIIVVNKTKVQKLKPYNPLYTWNRGGRLKELRIRCQARKYFYIWRNKSIGHITCLKAEVHYQNVLKRMVWRIWFEKYWSFRIEPRLFGRAILYRKSILIRSVFITWSQWTKSRKSNSIKLNAAIQFDRAMKMKLAFNNWMSWIIIKKCKHKLIKISENWKRKKLLNHILSYWKVQLTLKSDQNSKMIVAMSHYDGVLVKKIFLCWIDSRPVLKQLQLNHIKAVSNYRIDLLRRIFRTWSQYRRYCKLKAKEREKWNRHYSWNLAHRCLLVWRYNFQQSLTQEVIRMRSKKLCIHFQLRKYFFLWRQYHTNEGIKNCKLLKAETFRNRFIKKGVLKSWLALLELRKKKAALIERSCAYRDRSILKFHLNRWMIQLEKKEENNVKLEFSAARSHYRRSLLMKYIQQWSDYTMFVKVKNDKQLESETKYKSRLMRNVLHLWIEYVSELKDKKIIKELQKNFIRKNVLVKYWKRWHIETKNRQLSQRKLNDYLKGHTKDKLRFHFQKWYSATIFKLKEERAVAHHQKRIVNKYFEAFLCYNRNREKKKINNDLATMHFQTRLANKIFYEWRNYSNRKQNQKHLLVGRFERVKYNVKWTIFNCWKTILIEKNIQRQMALEFSYQKRYERVLQIFHAWKGYVRCSKAKKMDTNYKLKEAKLQLQRNFKKNIFQKWKMKMHLLLNELTKLRQADEFFRRKCTEKYLKMWLIHFEEYKMRSVKMQQSLWFYHRSAQVKVWIIWRKALYERQREEYYTRFALVHWYQKLTKKAFQSWLRYTLNHRNIRNKELIAFRMYKTRLERYTIRQWISSSDFLSQWRNTKWEKHHDITNSTAVLKAVEQWKKIAKIKTNSNQSIKPIRLDIFNSEIGTDETIPHFSKFVSKIKLQPPKIRPCPKIPDFLLESFHKTELLAQKFDNNLEPVPLIKCSSSQIQSGSCDEILLTPACFENQTDICGETEGKWKERSKEFLLVEINQIKERLQRFKESSNFLKDIESQLMEYDDVLKKAYLNTENSFYQEFDPICYRERLCTTVNELKKEIDMERVDCIKLSKRFQEIMKILK